MSDGFRVITSLEDEMNDVVRVAFPDGMRAAFAGREVRRRGLARLLDEIGHSQSGVRVNVWQGGRVVGTVPATFHPHFLTSVTWLYSLRHGDFRPAANGGWIASEMLGPGDLCAIWEFETVLPEWRNLP